MFPLPLLPVTDQDLSALDAREALRYQNSFMKNALIRGLNTIYTLATTIQDSTHPSIAHFLSYVQIVCEMLRLHVEGDEAFFTKRGANNTSLDELLGSAWSKNSERKKLLEMIKAWTGEVDGWVSAPASYKAPLLRKRLEEMEVPLMKGSFELVHCITPDIVSKKFDKEEMHDMVFENIEWLLSNSDTAVLIPYCIAHHDITTSKYWPVMAPEGLAAVPAMVQGNESKWMFAPFDPIRRTARL
ncbi:hypothetical protein CC1G_02027 [Coprinopsis cinerea okayama7|uniref:Hemerythrin-like domain-containing protein n=1 Tax=Coprinopsis cinerea (strain Okayama-7 / 130 / ATCC MYA-4618 / FGSC 9003) TaxID=240176 RepID=A8N6C2_COPC7|nr:hypothetical protein CC1G_02027 [Coprinopsis cinerea okayama7\|eukprot:XP_001830391.2 hypothetical protein CC1G_02027 [Coprinopsis cinerea okayama7\